VRVSCGVSGRIRPRSGHVEDAGLIAIGVVEPDDRYEAFVVEGQRSARTRKFPSPPLPASGAFVARYGVARAKRNVVQSPVRPTRVG
jgi:hypothetical protein